jgi:hypothetical protein
MSEKQRQITIRVDCDLLQWGWKLLRVPGNPSRSYYTITHIAGFRIEENGTFKLYEFKKPLPLTRFEKICKHIRSEISLCPVSYYVCTEEIFKHVKH